MPTMRKEDMIGFCINPFPGNFFPLLSKLPDFFLFWALGDGILMAFKAGVDVRHSGEALGFVKAVAGIALQSLFQMFFMVERDGLLGFGPETGAHEK
jgi:hypothetical protein